MADFSKVLADAMAKLDINFILKEKQISAIHAISVKKQDCFCVLPTGYGKSLIYQILPFVFDGLGINHVDSVIIVISLLNAIMVEQISKLAKKGIPCAVLRMRDDLKITDELKNAKFRILFAHPEVLVDNVVVKTLLKSSIYQKNVKAVVVDEAHLIVQWKSFRPAYANLNIIGTLLPTIPFLVLTGTANDVYQKEIIKSVGLTDPVMVLENLNRTNIFFSVHRRPNKEDKVDSVIRPLAIELKEKMLTMPLTIVFSDLKTCAESYSIFNTILGDDQYYPKGSKKTFENRLFAQYHAQYPEKYKTYLISSLIDGTSVTRVLLATVAYGIGVDCPNVDQVIHIGVPCSVEDFYQEVSRAGRLGQQAFSKMHFNSYDISKNKHSLNDTMRSYVQTKTCRRQILLNYFGNSVPEDQSCHNCCDNCQQFCQCCICNERKEDQELANACAALEVENKSDNPYTASLQENKSLSHMESKKLKENLTQYRLSSSETTSYVGITFTTGLSDKIIDLIVERFFLINSIDDLEKEIPLFSKSQAQDIWEILVNISQ